MVLLRSPLDHEPVPDVALRGLSAELHQALKAAAKRKHRSLNQEILVRLEASVVGPTVDVGTLLMRIENRRKRGAAGQLNEAILRSLKEDGR